MVLIALGFVIVTGPAADAQQQVSQGAMAPVPYEELAAIEKQLSRRLAWDRQLAPYSLQATVSESVVQLSGRVATAAESHLARQVAEETRGVSNVVNNIQVDATLKRVAETLEEPGDHTLQDRIRKLLRGDPDVQAEAVEVEVDAGHVRLAGEVPRVADRARAGHIARSLFGVRSVVNEIEAGH